MDSCAGSEQVYRGASLQERSTGVQVYRGVHPQECRSTGVQVYRGASTKGDRYRVQIHRGAGNGCRSSGVLVVEGQVYRGCRSLRASSQWCKWKPLLRVRKHSSTKQRNKAAQVRLLVL